MLTNEEIVYIQQREPVAAIIVRQGAAPLIYADEKGNAKGVFRKIVDLVSAKSGLVFKYRVHETATAAFSDSGGEVFVAISENYSTDELILSEPILITETILFANKNINLENLKNKKFAAVERGRLPENIESENVLYFPTREASLNAVEKGRADYGFGNVYSIAYYTALNNYKNIITIPKQIEIRKYSLALMNDDPLLLSVLNKAIGSIDDYQMQSIILEAAGDIEKKVTLSLIIDTYGEWITFVSLVVITILSVSVLSNVVGKRKHKQLNARYEALSKISNECLFEYKVKKKQLILSKQCHQLFDSDKVWKEATQLLITKLETIVSEKSEFTIKLPLFNGETATFRATNLGIEMEKGYPKMVIGKLVDISREIDEKEKLLLRSQVDGLSKVLNATTTKDEIVKALNDKSEETLGAFILIDCDDFKTINDTYGHLVGDDVLGILGAALKHTFDSNKIIGRIGGDEFCTYINEVSSFESLHKKCINLSELFKSKSGIIEATLSIGITAVKKGDTLEDIFKRADRALYQAKTAGKSKIVQYK